MQLHNQPPVERLRIGIPVMEREVLENENFVHHRWWRRWWREVLPGIGRVLIFVFEAMFDGGRMVREVGPGMRPLERHEFEKPYARDLGRRI